MTLEYRMLTQGDEAVFERVADEVFDEPIDPARMAAYLREPGHHMILAIEDGLVVGQAAAVVHRHPDKVTEIYVDEVGVSPAWQRRGIARELMRRMFDLGRSLGCEEAWLGTEPDNKPARALYKGLGGGEVEIVMYESDL